MHAKKIIVLKACLQKVVEESNRKLEKNARQMEEMRKMIQELTWALRGP